MTNPTFQFDTIQNIGQTSVWFDFLGNIKHGGQKVRQTHLPLDSNLLARAQNTNVKEEALTTKKLVQTAPHL